MDHRSSFERLVPDVLATIALHAFDPRRPHVLLSLFLTSRSVKAALDPLKTNILAGCFRVAFDTDAPARRLGAFNLTDRALADQLRLRYLTLRRVRAGRPLTPLPVRQRLSVLYLSTPALLKRDLWVLYLAIHEDDYKNTDLLVNWAGLQHWLWWLVSLRYRAQGRPWYALTQEDVEITSLILWLVWMTTTSDDILRETPAQRQTVRNLLHAFVLRGFQYPSSYFPPAFHSLPLYHFADLPPEARHLPFDIVPPTTTINHFSLPIRISYPPLVPPAMMLASARTFLGLRERPYHQYAQPADAFRAAAHHHWIHNTHISLPCTSASDPSREEDDEPTRSERNDEDWHRLVSCTDPFALEDEPILRGRVISPGTLSGSWHGVISHPDFAQFYNILLSPPVHPPTGDLDCEIAQLPFYCNLREYHSFEGSERLRTGESWHEHEDGNGEMELHGEGMINAWFPEGVRMQTVENAIIFEDSSNGSTHRYEEYLPHLKGYNTSVRSPRKDFPDEDEDEHACTFTWRKVSPFARGAGAADTDEVGRPRSSSSSAESQPESEPDFHSHGSEVGPGILDSSGDDDGEEGMEADAGEMVMEDHVDYASSGVQDIILAGETGPPGDAFGHYGLIARVRSWDGMVLMLRYPSDPARQPGPRWLFQGYIHAGGNFVGRWRDTQGGEAVQGLEGGFLLTKREEGTVGGEGEGSA